MKITRTNFYYIFCRRKCHAVLKNRLSTFKNSDVTVDLFSEPRNNLWTKFGNSGYGVYFCRKITRTNVFFMFFLAGENSMLFFKIGSVPTSKVRWYHDGTQQFPSQSRELLSTSLPSDFCGRYQAKNTI